MEKKPSKHLKKVSFFLVFFTWCEALSSPKFWQPPEVSISGGVSRFGFESCFFLNFQHIKRTVFSKGRGTVKFFGPRIKGFTRLQRYLMIFGGWDISLEVCHFCENAKKKTEKNWYFLNVEGFSRGFLGFIEIIKEWNGRKVNKRNN